MLACIYNLQVQVVWDLVPLESDLAGAGPGRAEPVGPGPHEESKVLEPWLLHSSSDLSADILSITGHTASYCPWPRGILLQDCHALGGRPESRPSPWPLGPSSGLGGAQVQSQGEQTSSVPSTQSAPLPHPVPITGSGSSRKTL